MQSELLFKIYQAGRIDNHKDVKLPEIKPQFKTFTVQPLRKHYQVNNYG